MSSREPCADRDRPRRVKAYEQFRYLILSTLREGWRLLSEDLRPLGLTPPKAEVLRVLSTQGPLALRQLGQRLVCETGSPSRLVDGLVRQGLVKREPDPRDRRAVLLSLTAAGRAAEKRVIAIEQRFDREMSRRIDQKAIKTINESLWRFVADHPTGRALTLRTGRQR